jgi:hypothetical protein
MWRHTDNSLRPRWRFLALIGLSPLLALAQTAPPAQPFQRLDGCAYKPQRWDDGDSFHVILPDQKELIFRLYFVDTPEEERVYADRIAEQAAYFGITPDAAIQIGPRGKRVHKTGAHKAVHDLHTLAARTRPQRDLAILRNSRHGRRTRLERAACERGTCANLRHANTAAGWS